MSDITNSGHVRSLGNSITKALFISFSFLPIPLPSRKPTKGSKRVDGIQQLFALITGALSNALHTELYETKNANMEGVA